MPPPVGTHTPLIARNRELSALHDAFEKALQTATPTVIYIYGDAGVGKSTLVNAAEGRFAAARCRRITIPCNPQIQQPLDAVKRILRACFEIKPTLSPEKRTARFRELWGALAGDDPELQRIESIIGSLLGYEWEDSIWSVLAIRERPSQLRSSFATLIVRLLADRPLLLQIDNAQWLDSTSLEYLRAIAPGGTHPLLIVAACRREPEREVDFALPEATTLSITLEPLPLAGTRELLCSLLGLEEVPAATVELIQAQAGGNALFSEQLCAFLREQEHLDTAGRLQGDLEHLRRLDIEEVIGSRLDRLSPPLRECVESAALLGLEFDTRALVRMSGGPVEAELAEGIANHIWQHLDDRHYAFTHILIREAACRRPRGDRLRELHRRAGEALEAVYSRRLDERAEEIGKHFEEADELLRTAEYYNRAGGYYKARGEYGRVQPLLERALAIRSELLGEEHLDTATVINDLAMFLRGQDDLVRAEELHQRALKIRETILGTSHTETAQSVANLASLYATQGRYAEAEELDKRVLVLMETALGSDHPDTAITLNSLALIYKNQGRYLEAEQLYRRSLTIREKAFGPEHTNVAVVLANLAALYFAQGRYPEQQEVGEQALAIQEAAVGRDHPSMAIMLNSLAGAYWKQNRLELAVEMIERTLTIRRKTLGAEHTLTAISLNNLASLYRDQQRYAEAESLLEEALAITEKAYGESDHPEIANVLHNLAAVYQAQERCDEAEPLFERVLNMRTRALGPDHPLTLVSLKSMVRLFEKNGDETKAAFYRSRLPG